MTDTQTTAPEAPAGGSLPTVTRVPRSKASLAQNRYRFLMPEPDETVYDVPLLKFLKPSIVLAADELSETAFIKLLFSEYLPGVFDRFEDAEQLSDFMAGWSAASGISTGESEASPS